MYLQVVHCYDQKHKDTCCYRTCTGSRRKLLTALRGEAVKENQGGGQAAELLIPNLLRWPEPRRVPGPRVSPGQAGGGGAGRLGMLLAI